MRHISPFVGNSLEKNGMVSSESPVLGHFASRGTLVDDFVAAPAHVSPLSQSIYLVASHLPTTIRADASSPAKEFEPQLNAPAFVSFMVIVALFTLLQLRVRAIETAAIDRTTALEQLRDVKKRELDGTVKESEVTEAFDRYRNAVLKVERLRTVIPGVARIVQPPSQALTLDRMDENVKAAKQFLDMDLGAPVSENDSEQPGMSLGLKIVLALVATVQIGTLLLLSLDPMSPDAMSM